LAKKKTYPALYELWQAGLLPPNNLTSIRGFARTQKTNDGLRAHLRPLLLKEAAKRAAEERDAIGTISNPLAVERSVDEFLSLCSYDSGTSYGDVDAVYGILRSERQCDGGSFGGSAGLHNLLVYLAVPPHVFGESGSAVKAALARLAGGDGGDNNDDNNSAVPGFVRVVVEKPFGRDTDSCNELLRALKDQGWDESCLYRIDHYLGKETVQTILPFRQHNPWLNAIWNKDTVSSVHLVFKEPFGTDGRGGYFDPVGIIRDVLQNHLLQVLTLLAMELPSSNDDKVADNGAVRDAKVRVLQSMPEITLADTLIGQYDGYRDDPTIEDRDTVTPTYACVRCWVRTETWAGVPFVLEAGKALDERVCEARMHLRGSGANNSLVFRLQPVPAVFFTANLKTPGYSKTPVSTHMGVDYVQSEKPGAYTRLLLDVCRGLQSNFVRDDELREAWRVFSPLLNRLEQERVVPVPYREGTTGPPQRQEFLNAAGVEQVRLPLPSHL